MGQQREQLCVAVVKVHDHRGTETAQDRRHGFLGHVFERDRLSRLRHDKQVAVTSSR
jgi:hypothetical protein